MAEESDDDSMTLDLSPPNPGKRRRSNYAERFLDLAASEESEDDVEEKELTAEDLAMKQLLEQRPQKRHLFFEGEDDMNDNELAAILEEKYKHVVHRKETPEDSRMATSALLPRPSDPKIFAVKVRRGMARVVALRLLNKCHYHAHRSVLNQRQDLGIISVFSLDHIREFVYVESHRQRFVEQAVDGLDHVFKFRIIQVDSRELILQQKKEDNLFPTGTRVRLRDSGPYGGDIGEVRRSMGSMLELRFVPREDFVHKPFVRRTWRRGMPRLPQRRFVHQQAIGAIVRDETVVWGELIFDLDGYLLKRVSSSKVTAVVDNLSEDSNSSTLLLGDTIKVVSGSMRGLIGTIQDLKAEGRHVVVVTKQPTGGEVSITVEMADVAKHFPDGSHVQVINGALKGESGTVLHSSSDGWLVFLGDRGSGNHRVRIADCAASTHATPCASKIGSHRLYDLVALNDNRAGCIIGLYPQRVLILTPENIRSTVPMNSIRATLSSQLSGAVDATGEPLRCGDMVEFIEHCVRCGQVKYLYRGIAFLHCDFMRENGGMMAVPARETRVLGRTRNPSAKSNLPRTTKRSSITNQPPRSSDVASVKTINYDD